MSRVKGKAGKKTRAPHVVAVLIVAVLCVLFYATEAAAVAEVAYKGPKDMKALFPDQKGFLKKSTAAYRYDPRGKTDPFRSFLAVQESIEEKRRRKPRTYLETLNISQLDLIAIIVGPRGNWAMVRDAKGIGYVVKKGTYIGINGGVIHKITEKKVIIREQRRDIVKKLYSVN